MKLFMAQGNNGWAIVELEMPGPDSFDYAPGWLDWKDVTSYQDTRPVMLRAGDVLCVDGFNPDNCLNQYDGAEFYWALSNGLTINQETEDMGACTHGPYRQLNGPDRIKPLEDIRLWRHINRRSRFKAEMNMVYSKPLPLP